MSFSGYKNLAESITDTFYAFDKDLRITFWNRSSEKLTGKSSEEITGKLIYEVFPDFKGTSAEKAYLDVLKTGKGERIISKYSFEGTDRFFELSVYPCEDGISVIGRDITEIYKSPDSLNTAEERYRDTFDNMLEGCAIISYDWKYIYANKVHKEHAQINVEDIMGKSLFDLVPGFRDSSFYKSFNHTMEERVSRQIEDYFVFSGGEKRWYETRSIPLPEGIFILSMDITKRKINEQELLRYQSILTQTEKMAHLGSWWIEVKNGIKLNDSELNWSEEVYRIFGYEPFSIKVTNELFFSHVHPDDQEEIKQKIADAVKNRQTYDLEHRIICADGTEKIVHEYANVIYDEDGNPERIIGAVNDITNLRTAIKERDSLLTEIEREKDKLQTIIDSVPVEIWVFDKDGSLMFVNPAVAKGLGLTKHESLTLESVLDQLEIRHLDGSIRKPEESALYESLKGKFVTGDEMVRHLKTGEVRFRHFASTPIRDKNGDVSGVVVVVNDITEHKRSEEKILELLRLSELRGAELNATIESMPDAVYIGSREGIFLCNSNALKMLGADTLDDLKSRVGELGLKFNIRWPETGIPLSEDELQFTRALNGETVVEEVLATNAATGEDIFIRSACAPIILDGLIIGAVAVNTDITEKKKAENLIISSLQEKEVLLRELYHRTKNNMQVISSIIGLKAATVSDPETSDILEEMKNRILSIALVHQKLYQSQNLSKVNLKEYITDLLELLDSTYTGIKGKINVHLELEPINVLIDTAIPCGLIINELVTNSFKYAFPGNAAGDISICLKKDSRGIIELIVADNGRGMTEKELEQNQKLGLQLVNIVALDQLQADIKTDFNEGAKWTFRFKDMLYKERV